MPQSTRKRLRGAAYCASPEQCLSSAGKILVRAKFCPKTRYFPIFQGTEILNSITNYGKPEKRQIDTFLFKKLEADSLLNN